MHKFTHTQSQLWPLGSPLLCIKYYNRWYFLLWGCKVVKWLCVGVCPYWSYLTQNIKSQCCVIQLTSGWGYLWWGKRQSFKLHCIYHHPLQREWRGLISLDWMKISIQMLMYKMGGHVSAFKIKEKRKMSSWFLMCDSFEGDVGIDKVSWYFPASD